MLKKSLITAFMSLLVFSSSNTFAFKWGAKAKITGYFVYADGGAFINVDVKENPNNCADMTYLALDTKAANFKEMYSAVMTAQISGQTVSLNYDGCLGNYPKINAVAVPGVW